MPDQPAESDMDASAQMTRQAAAAKALSEYAAAVQSLARRSAPLTLSAHLLEPSASVELLKEQAAELRLLAQQIATLSQEFRDPTSADTLGEVLNMHAAATQRLAEQAATLSSQLPQFRNPEYAARILGEHAGAVQELAKQAQSLSNRVPSPAELEARRNQDALLLQNLQEVLEQVERLKLEEERLERQHDTDAASSISVSIYLADATVHEQVEAAVEQWLSTADVSIDSRGEPVIGSWFRSIMASLKKAAETPAAKEAMLTAVHAADSHLMQAQDAYVTATLLQNVGPVLQALQPTKDAVVRARALLIVKIDWVVQIHQLTAAQQAILDHQPHLASSPKDIVAALQ